MYSDATKKISNAVYILHKVDWNGFSEKEKTATENSILLVGFLRKMCKVSLVKKAEDSNDMNEVNQIEIDKTIQESEQVLGKLELQ